MPSLLVRRPGPRALHVIFTRRSATPASPTFMRATVRPIIATAIIQSDHRKRILADYNPGCSNPDCDRDNPPSPSIRESLVPIIPRRTLPTPPRKDGQSTNKDTLFTPLMTLEYTFPGRFVKFQLFC